jgi:hypothetical protein
MLESKMASKEFIYLTAESNGHKVGDKIILTGKVIEIYNTWDKQGMVLIEIKKDHSLTFHN